MRRKDEPQSQQAELRGDECKETDGEADLQKLGRRSVVHRVDDPDSDNIQDGGNQNRGDTEVLIAGYGEGGHGWLVSNGRLVYGRHSRPYVCCSFLNRTRCG